MLTFFKRLGAIFVILSMLLSSVACTPERESAISTSASNQEDPANTTAYTRDDTDRITFQTKAAEQGTVSYDFTYSELDVSGWFIDSISSAQNDIIYFIGAACNENGIINDGTEYEIMQYDASTQEVVSCIYTQSSNEFFSEIIAVSDGVWCIICRDVDFQALTYDLFLLHINDAGEVLCEIALPDDSQNMGHSDLAVDLDGNIYYKDYAGNLVVYSDQGETLFSYDAAEYVYSTLGTDGSGNIYMEAETESGVNLYRIDPSSKSIDHLTEVVYDFSGDVRLVSGNKENELLLVDSVKPVIYNTASGELTPMESLDPYGLSDMQYLTYLSSDSLVCLPSHDSSGVICKLSISTDAASEKQVLTLASATQNNHLENAIRDFNRSNAEYYIQILDFSDYLNAGDYTELFHAWNLAFSDGDFPDLIDFASLPYTSYAEKGYLVDLNQYLDTDSILPWVWNSLSYNGANYTFPSAVQIQCLYAKETTIAENQWDISSFLQFVGEKLTDDTQLIYGCSNSLFINYITNYMASNFIDYETSTASFDSADFISLLNVANALPENDEDTFVEEDTSFYIRRNQSLLGDSTITSLKQMQQLEDIYVGEGVSFVGWPGVGNLVSPLSDIAIMSVCENIEVAIAFLEFLMSDSVQKDFQLTHIPITTAAFNSYCESLQQPGSSSSEVATQIEVDGISYSISPLTDAQIERYSTILSQCTKRRYLEWEIANIIEEECAAFLEGESSAETVAKLIQNRVQIYLSKQK